MAFLEADKNSMQSFSAFADVMKRFKKLFTPGKLEMIQVLRVNFCYIELGPVDWCTFCYRKLRLRVSDFFVVKWFNFEEPLHNLWTQDQPALGVRNFRAKELFSGE